MVKLALKKITQLILLASTCCLVATFTLPVFCLATDQNTQLSEIEQRLFFRTYASEDTSARLDRIEQRVFGQSLTGSAEERLNKISSVTKSADVLSEPSKSSGANNKVAPSSTIENQAQAPTPKNEETDEVILPKASPKTDSKNSAPSTEPTKDEKEYAKERARVAVMAAREEEIASLLADGVALWRQKKGPEAKDRFAQVVRLDPYNTEAHFSMGIIEETSGNLNEAISHYRIALKGHPDSQEYQATLARAESKLKNQPALTPAQLQAHNLADDAVAAYKRGEFISALDLYRQIDRLSPNQALVKYNIGTIYLLISQPGQALEYYRQAKELAPNDERFSQAYKKLQSAADKAHLQAPEPVDLNK